MTPYIILGISVALGLIGLAIERIPSLRPRGEASGKAGSVSFDHRNYRLIGGFNSRGSRIYYHSFCLGPLPLVPTGCYVSETCKASGVTRALNCNVMEIIALYLRWAWVVAFVALLAIVL